MILEEQLLNLLPILIHKVLEIQVMEKLDLTIHIKIHLLKYILIYHLTQVFQKNLSIHLWKH